MKKIILFLFLPLFVFGQSKKLVVTIPDYSAFATNTDLTALAETLRSEMANIEADEMAMDSIAGNGSMAIDTSAVQLASNTCKRLTITVMPQYWGTVYVGVAGTTKENGFPMKAGDIYKVKCSNTNWIYVIGSIKDTSNVIRYSWEN